jgi:sarcosine oxidase subunit alpha
VTAPRLPAPFGQLIDRSRKVAFTFDGRNVEGYAGDTISSALAGSGRWLLSRSFKYHRPRGILSAAGLEANTVVQVGAEPNVLADRRAIEPGMAVRAVNTFGSLDRDFGRILEKFSRFLPAGFYYRAFYTPRIAWRFWEPVIRRMAGLGTVDVSAHHGYYDKAYMFADVAVIGGGIAGMTAALEAAAAGAEVVLIDDAPQLGGSLLFARPDKDAGTAQALAADLAAKVAAESRIAALSEATCQGIFADGWLSVTQNNCLFKLRAAAIVAATGTYEQPAVFRNNDLPGIMLGTAAQRVMRLWAVKPGNRAVVLAANPDAYGVALDLLDAGVAVEAIADLGHPREEDGRVAAVRARGVSILPQMAIAEAIEGDKHVAAVRLAPVTGPGRFGFVSKEIACDLVCVSVGYIPSTQLLSQGGARLVPDEATCMPTVADLPPGLFAAGSVDGMWSVERCLADGRRSGLAAAAHSGKNCTVPEPLRPDSDGLTYPNPIFPHPKGKDFIEFDEDVQVKDIIDAAAMGWDHIQLLKRFSTAGMGPSQGKLYNALVQKALSGATACPPPTVGTVTIRPPVFGEKLGHLAGRAFEPVRLTAMHHRHLAAGAQMMPAGLWMRPAFYGSDMETAVRAEVLAARRGVGLIDVSTLGGLDIRGPDAARFLERIYTWTYEKLAVGRVRYVLMLDETGVIIDDGVAARLHERHFYVTATTSGVDRVFRLMQFYNAQWRMKVDIANVTAAYAGVNLIGPHSREVLAQLGTGIDIGAEAFPYLGIRTGIVGGIPARVMRVGFGGELGYEIHAPASRGEELWDKAMAAGEPFGIRPVGVEAQRVLRLEKGHIIVGQDTDGLTHPAEAGMGWAIGRKKKDFIGKAAMDILEAKGITRKLAGFVLVNDAGPAPKENHLVIRDGQIVGRVTSIARSPALGVVVGLAYVAPDQAEPGRTFTIRVDGGQMVTAATVALPFYDPANKRQEM